KLPPASFREGGGRRGIQILGRTTSASPMMAFDVDVADMDVPDTHPPVVEPMLDQKIKVLEILVLWTGAFVVFVGDGGAEIGGGEEEAVGSSNGGRGYDDPRAGKGARGFHGESAIGVLHDGAGGGDAIGPGDGGDIGTGGSAGEIIAERGDDAVE